MSHGQRQKEVTRLLKRGLNHYGLGDLEAAIGCWEQARALDPENQAVHDYLQTAYEELAKGERRGLAVLAGHDAVERVERHAQGEHRRQQQERPVGPGPERDQGAEAH